MLIVKYRTSNRVLSFGVDIVAKETLIFCNFVRGHSVEIEIEVSFITLVNVRKHFFTAVAP